MVARHLWNKLSPAALMKAETWFRSSVERDPRSALAHAGLGDVLYFQGEFGIVKPEVAFSQAKAEALKAVELDPRLPLGHVVLGASLHAGDFMWPEAEREFKKALQLDPQCVRALQGYGCFLMRSTRFKEARDIINKAVLLDPASPILGVLTARISYYSRDYHRAVRELQEVIDRDPGFGLAHFYLGLCYGYLGRPKEAEAEMHLARLGPGALADNIAWIRARNGDPGLAAKLVDEGGDILFAATESGRLEKAFEILQKGLDHRSAIVLGLRAEPRFDPIRPDPRFSDLLRRVNRAPAATPVLLGMQAGWRDRGPLFVPPTVQIFQ
jgi:tetratricopeptide (TPR) repeat protein